MQDPLQKSDYHLAEHLHSISSKVQTDSLAVDVKTRKYREVEFMG